MTQPTAAPPPSQAPPGEPRLSVQGDYLIGDKILHQSATGDIVNRDKIVNQIQNIYARALSAVEEAEQARAFDQRRLAEGVVSFARRLSARVAAESRAPATASAGSGAKAKAALGPWASPYKGLLEYHLSDAELFFGRQRATADLLGHLNQGPLTVLHSESGAGKTSLLQAGLSPLLIAVEYLPVYLRPYSLHPGLALKRAFLPELAPGDGLHALALRDFLSRASTVLGPTTALYILLDQFEEFFTRVDSVDRAGFVQELAECLEDDSLNVRWLLSLRTEDFGRLAGFRPRIRRPFDNDYTLKRLTRDEARQAMVGPAQRRGLAFESGVTESLLDDLEREGIAPPQMQLVCSALYEALPAGEPGEQRTRTITRALYEAQGGAAGILRGHVGRVLKRDVPAGQRLAAQRLLEALMTSELQRVRRSRAELAAELAPQGVAADVLDQVLGQLVDSRLLRVEELDDGLAYELAHDYLLGEVNLDPAVQARKAAQELLEQEVRAYRRHGTLLSDDKLAIIAARRGELVLSGEAQALLAKSELALRRRQRLVFGGVGVALALIAVAVISLVALAGAQNAARLARKDQATSQAGSTTLALGLATSQSESTDVAFGLATSQAASTQAMYGVARAETQSAQALFALGTIEAQAAVAATRGAIANEVLQRTFEKTGVVPVGGGPSALAFDGLRLWVANDKDGTVQSIDPATGQAGPAIAVSRGSLALAFDGERLWVANREVSGLQTINPATLNVEQQALAVGQFPEALAYDGRRLWVLYGDNTVQAMDPATGQFGPSIAAGQFPRALAFDGTRLWVADSEANAVLPIDAETGQAGSSVAVGGGPLALAFDGARLWVANWADSTVQAIEPEAGQVVRTVHVGLQPSALAYDGLRLWVANWQDGSVQAINPVTGDAGPPLAVGRSPQALLFDGAKVWVANYADATVQGIDPTAGDVSLPIRVGSYPTALVSDGVQLWVANMDDDTVQAIDPATGQAGAPIPVGRSPMALASDGRLLWVVNADDNTVQSIDPATGAAGHPIGVGASPRSIVFDGSRLWVAHASDYTVQAVDPAAGRAGIAIPVNDSTQALAYDGQRLWVAHWSAGTLQWVDPATGEAGPPIRVGSGPQALTFDGQRLWVAIWWEDAVRAIDPATGTAGPAIAVGKGPVDLAFDGEHLWVANATDSTLQMVDPATGQASPPIAVGNTPRALYYDGRQLWVADTQNTVRSVMVYGRGP